MKYKAVEDFTDAEIIAAYEKALKGGRKNEALGVQVYNLTGNILQATINLINRQKAEIERLQGEVDKVNHDYILLCSDVAENRAEAIKEFAGRLKAIYGEWLYDYQIDDLVKEMVGDNDG